MKRLSFLTILLLLSLQFRGAVLSTSAEFSLLTCSEGTDVYSLFGHTAIRVNNSEKKQDYVFNYGLFDFSSENFIYKFVKGETYYMLGVQTFESFLFSYQVENRSVWEQKLNLTPDQKRKLINILATDYKPENRTYLYNFLYNNCATKVRDDLEQTLDISDYRPDSPRITFREILQPYLKAAPWTRFGINLALGQPLEDTITQREKLFLPIELMNAYKKKGYATDALYHAEPVSKSIQLLTPSLFFTVLLIILLIRFFYAGNTKNWPLILLLFISGSGGLILTFISFFSIHPAVFPNFNILILQPLNILGALYLTFFRRKRVFYILYLSYYIAALLIILVVKQATTLPIILLTLNIIVLISESVKANSIKKAV
ncbi:DUF4105 domain-containing protein [Saccharicrinis sp. FJH54]|uniref:Lnb N-terminal periplasmic domain-containing protein n=1 Tax=Saccharicrinis sp. FJH54 TaxID=3344665 RepID=UPI0035D47991